MTSIANIKLEGADWELFRKFAKNTWFPELKREVHRATGRSALHILSTIRRKINSKEYAVNAYSTARTKGYSTPTESPPLIDTGVMVRDVLLAKQVNQWAWEVGAIGTQPNRKTGKPYREIIPIIHDGATYTVKKGNGSATIRIPARPFLRVVFEDPQIHKHIRDEWNAAIYKVLRKYGKL
jgi:hypothetical protein